MYSPAVGAPLRPPGTWLLLVDDHPFTRAGLLQYLRSDWPGETVVAVDAWADAAAALAQRGAPALVIMDFWLRDGSALPTLAAVQQDWPGVPVLVMSGDDRAEVVQRAQRAGAHGFVGKSEPPTVLSAAIEALLGGQRWFPARRHGQGVAGPVPTTAQELGLTPQQGRVLAGLMEGKSNKVIARELDLAESTVKEHVTALLARLGADTRWEVMAMMQGRVLVQDE